MNSNRNEESSFGFYRKPSCPVLILTGASRTGKTTLARELARQDRFEFIDEPWLPMFLPVVVDQGLCDEFTAKSLLATYLDELCNDVVLCRRANFRPEDLSSIWKFKRASAVFDRLTKLKSREDVSNWVADKGTVFVLALPEVTPFISFFLEAIESVKVINIFRNKADLAAEIESKRWFSTEQLIEPRNNQPYCRYQPNGQTWYMPWWLPQDLYDSFIAGGEGGRAKMYADIYDGHAEQLRGRIETGEMVNVVQARSEDILCGEGQIPDNVSSFLSEG